jgi:hypothetical protein
MAEESYEAPIGNEPEIVWQFKIDTKELAADIIEANEMLEAHREAQTRPAREQKAANDTARKAEQDADDLKVAQAEEAKRTVIETLKAIQYAAQQTSQAIATITNAIDKGEFTPKDALELSQHAADIAGQLTGLPIGEVFGAVSNVIKDIVEGISLLVVKNEQWYKDDIKLIANLERANQLTEDRLTLLRLEEQLTQSINNIYKTRVDTAAERAAAMRTDIETTKATIEAIRGSLQSDIGTSLKMNFADPESIKAQVKNAQTTILQYQANIREADRQLAKEAKDWASLSVDDQKRWENVKLIAEDSIPLLQTMIQQGQQLLSDQASLPDLLRGLQEDRLAELEHRKNMGQYKKQDLKYLQDRLKIEDDLLALAIQQYNNGVNGTITQQELWRIEEQRYQTQQAILEAMKAQSNEGLRQLHQQRQAEILAARTSGLTPGQRTKIAALEAEILAKMLAAGASAEDITSTKQAFAAASYQSGIASVPKTGLALVHEEERIFSKSQNQALIDAINNIPKYPPITELIPLLAMYAAQGNAPSQKSSSSNFTANFYITEAGDARRTAEVSLSAFQDWHRSAHLRDGTANGR